MESHEAETKLSGLTLLKNMPQETRAKTCRLFVDIAKPRALKDGETLLREGHLGFESGYFLVEGRVVIERDGQTLLEVAGPDMLGEMSQFKHGDIRTATVRAKGEASFLQFYWQDLYEQAAIDLSEAEYELLINAIEDLVWDRFGHPEFLDLPLFRGLDRETRREVCVVFPWIAERLVFKANDVIFEEGNACKASGYLLTKGAVIIQRGGGATGVAVNAPNLFGVFPNPEASDRWTATASARDDAEIFVFSWRDFTKRVKRRLDRDGVRKLVESINANGNAHFWK